MMHWVQLIGIVAMLLDISSVQFKYRKHILFVQIIASLSWVTHFLLLGATAGGVMNLVGVVRSVGFYLFPKRRHRLAILFIIIGLSIVTTALLWRGLLSLLPMSAMIVAAVAFWQTDEQKIRWLLLAAVPFWFIYNSFVGSYAGMLSDSIAAASLTVALYRYRAVGTMVFQPRYTKDVL